MKQFFVILVLNIFISCSKDVASTNNGGLSNSTWVELKNTNSAFGTDSHPNIYTMCTDNNNYLYIAGTLFGGIDGYFVAKWDGKKWSRLGTGANALNANSYITQLCADNNGNIYATGNFNDPDGYCYIAKWNGVNWTNIGSPQKKYRNTGYILTSLISDSQNNIYIIARETSARTSQYPIVVYKWDGNKWLQLGRNIVVKAQTLDFGPLYGNSPALSVGNDGSVYFTGDSINNYQTVTPYSFLAKLNEGTFAISDGPGNYSLNNVSSICSSNKYGLFCIASSSAGTISVLNWQNSKWTDLGYGKNFVNNIMTWNQKLICSDAFGNIYLAGRSTSDNLYYISKYSGSGWNGINNPIVSSNLIDFITQITTDKAGNLYAISTYDSSKVLMLKK